jgi:tRNA(Ile)-lysidine synthase
MQLTAQYIESFLLARQPSRTIYIAYSGGLDSHVLLHLCATSKLVKHKITAVYIDHGLQAEADAWSEHCGKIANQLGVRFKAISVVAVAQRGESPEEAARIARYQAFQQLLGDDDLLLLAQHQDDQLETVLLQLFRGAGVQGLSGMPESTIFGKGAMLRPLLGFSRDEIESYAKQWVLSWVVDQSNQDCAFNRNYIRHQVIPVLKQRWPSVGKTVSRAARHCAQAQVMIDGIVEQPFKQVFDATEQTLIISRLQCLPIDQQMQVIRKWFRVLDWRVPTESLIAKIFSEVIDARQSSAPIIRQQQFSVRRFRDALYLLVNEECPDLSTTSWWAKPLQQLKLKHNGSLVLNRSSSGILFSVWQQAEVTVGYRQGGEWLRLKGRKGRHSLKKLFQEWAVPPWQREKMPLIFLDGVLAAVGDLGISADFFSEADEACVQLSRIREHEERLG